MSRRLTQLCLLLALVAAVQRPARASVTLTAFTATGGPDRITLAWETASELDTFGFYVWRTTVAAASFAAIPADQRARVNAQPVAAVGDVTGAAYSLVDSAVMPDITYYYWLEDVDNSGLSTFHGAPSARLTVTGQIGRPPTATAAPTVAPSITPTGTATAAAATITPPPATGTPVAPVPPTAAPTATPAAPEPSATSGPQSPAPVTSAAAAAAPPTAPAPTRARRTVAAPTATPTVIGAGEDSAESPPTPHADPTSAPNATATPVVAAVIGAGTAVQPTRALTTPAEPAPHEYGVWMALAAAAVTLGSAAFIGISMLRRHRPPAQGIETHGDD